MTDASHRQRAGRVELAVRRDLREMGAGVARSALGELVLVLARAIDQRSGDAANSTTAKLVSELRVSLAQLREVARDRGTGETDGDLGTPVWDDPQRPADPGAEGGGGGEAAG